MTTEHANPFTRAKEILGPNGENWGTACQRRDGKICVERAIGSRIWGEQLQDISLDEHMRARSILRGVLTEQYPEEVSPFRGEVISWTWNDRVARGPGEVMAMLDKGEAKWDEGR